MSSWSPFRPSQNDLDRIADDVAAIPAIQDKLLANHPDLSTPDRVAHQYQIAGGRVDLTIAENPPENLSGVGLFEPGSNHIGIGRVSTGLGCPHLETDPDFLGLSLAFQSDQGARVDFLSINHPAAPTDTHQQFVKLLEATAEGAGAEPPFGSGLGELDLLDLLASNTKLTRSLIGSLGIKRGGGTALHVLGQTVRTAKSSTAYQSYWTGAVEVGGHIGKVVFVPTKDDNPLRALKPGERHMTEDWRNRQAAGPLAFDLHWLPFIDEASTPLGELTEPWKEEPQKIGQAIFPQIDWQSEEAKQWAALAAEIGANPGNWVRDAANSIAEPATEFTCARKIAYRLSQTGRDALPEELYAAVFQSGQITESLAAELDRRRHLKKNGRHIDTAP